MFNWDTGRRKKCLRPPLKAEEIEGRLQSLPRLYAPIIPVHCMRYTLVLNSNSIFGLPGNAMVHSMFLIFVVYYLRFYRCYGPHYCIHRSPTCYSFSDCTAAQEHLNSKLRFELPEKATTVEGMFPLLLLCFYVYKGIKDVPSSPLLETIARHLP